MFEIGWTEMLVIAVVMIVVVGPKDLPQMLRQFGRTTAKLRAMAGDFRKQFDEALKEADLEDVKKSVESLRGLNPTTEIRKQLNPFQQAAQDVRSGIETAMKPKPSLSSEPAAPAAHPAEPLKAGPTEMPASAPPLPTPDIVVAPPPAALPVEVALGDGVAPAEPAPIAAPPPAAGVRAPRARRKAAAPTDGASPTPAEPGAAPRKRATRKPAETSETPS